MNIFNRSASSVLTVPPSCLDLRRFPQTLVLFWCKALPTDPSSCPGLRHFPQTLVLSWSEAPPTDQHPLLTCKDLFWNWLSSITVFFSGSFFKSMWFFHLHLPPSLSFSYHCILLSNLSLCLSERERRNHFFSSVRGEKKGLMPLRGKKKWPSLLREKWHFCHSNKRERSMLRRENKWPLPLGGREKERMKERKK